MNKAGSLKLRLILTAAIGISFSLIFAGFSFYIIFQRHIERAAIAELQNHFIQLAASIRVDDTGALRARTSLSDPRFQKPYGGLYWQINEGGKTVLRSRSLFDDDLPVPKQLENADPNFDTVHIISGPHATRLFALEKRVMLQTPNSGERKLDITLAIDRVEIDNPVRSYGYDLITGLGILYLALLAGSYLQIFIGLKPLEVLRGNIAKIRQGSEHNIAGSHPIEVAPLVDEVNGLLLARENQLTKARQRAGNLAHGLKTPLTILAAVADTVEVSGLGKDAKDIRDSADQMRMLVERELARARTASGYNVKLTEVSPIVTRMINALKKTSNTEILMWHSSVPSSATLAMEPSDLLECVGNILENARNWAQSQIYVSWSNGILKIVDDGRGVPDDQISKILQRGVRLDQSVGGSGLGLAIVADMAEAYGFELKLERSSLGGLSVSFGKTV